SAFNQKMVENKWLGAKTKKGFYEKQGKEILELNYETVEFEQVKKLKTTAIEMAKQQRGLANRVKTVVYAEDRTGELLWNIFAPTLVYSAQLHGEIADDIVAIDNAMKWGFGWRSEERRVGKECRSRWKRGRRQEQRSELSW